MNMYFAQANLDVNGKYLKYSIGVFTASNYTVNTFKSSTITGCYYFFSADEDVTTMEQFEHVL